MRTGLIVGLTNPKAFVIMAAIVPQFVDRDAGHVTAQLLILALVPLAIGLVTDDVGIAAGAAATCSSPAPDGSARWAASAVCA